jgi:hypothetical protein
MMSLSFPILKKGLQWPGTNHKSNLKAKASALRNIKQWPDDVNQSEGWWKAVLKIALALQSPCRVSPGEPPIA